MHRIVCTVFQKKSVIFYVIGQVFQWGVSLCVIYMCEFMVTEKINSPRMRRRKIRVKVGKISPLMGLVSTLYEIEILKK